jgi:adenosylhomocysteine nucleosidase
MESGAVGGVAADAGVPFLAVRVVADAAEDVLPRNVEDWVAPDGAPRLAPLWRTLLAPRELGRLALLARRSRAAERVLAAVASRAIAPSAGSVGSAASTT